MVTWIICFVMNVSLSLLMIFSGKIFTKKPPVNINSFYGYRTAMSTKNEDTWDFAHRYFGKQWIRTGFISLPFAVIPMLLVLKKDVGVIGVTGQVAMFFEIFLMIAPIFSTEKALRKKFDRNGNRKGE